MQQREPSEPLSFPLALEPVFIENETKLPNLAENNFYLDDGILVGTDQQLCSALKLLIILGEDCGLELKKTKI